MQYPRLEDAALGQIDDSYYYGATCADCKTTKRLSLERLRRELGDGYALAKVRERLKCQDCGGKRFVICFWTPAERYNFTEVMFEKPPI